MLSPTQHLPSLSFPFPFSNIRPNSHTRILQQIRSYTILLRVLLHFEPNTLTMSQSAHTSTYTLDGSNTKYPIVPPLTLLNFDVLFIPSSSKLILSWPTSNTSTHSPPRPTHKFSNLTNQGRTPLEIFLADTLDYKCTMILRFQNHREIRVPDERRIIHQHQKDMGTTLAALERKLKGLV